MGKKVFVYCWDHGYDGRDVKVVLARTRPQADKLVSTDDYLYGTPEVTVINPDKDKSGIKYT